MAILKELAVTSEYSQKFPALQVSTYRPNSPEDEIQFVISSSSKDCIDSFMGSPEFSNTFSEIPCYYGGKKVTMYKLPENSRFVPLFLPMTYVKDKETGKLSKITKGMKMGNGTVTTAKLYLGIVDKRGIVTNSNSEPLIFTLKLESNNTSLVNLGEISLASINEMISDAVGQKGFYLHLVSLEISPYVTTRTSKGKSSLAVAYGLSDLYLELCEEDQKTMSEFVRSPEVKELKFGKSEGNLTEGEDYQVDYSDQPF